MQLHLLSRDGIGNRYPPFTSADRKQPDIPSPRVQNSHRSTHFPSKAQFESKSLIGSAGYDVSPGLDTAASSPEAIWQTSRWWQGYFTDLGLDQMHTRYHYTQDLAAGAAWIGELPEATRRPAKRTTPATRAGLGSSRLPEPMAIQSATARLFKR